MACSGAEQPTGTASRASAFLWDLFAGPRGPVLVASGISLVPLLVLLAASGGDSGAAAAFRAQPANFSYELMTAAVGLAVLVAALLESRIANLQASATPRPKSAVTPTMSAYGLYQVTWSWTQVVLNAVIGCGGASALWALLAAIPATSLGWITWRTSSTRATPAGVAGAAQSWSCSGVDTTCSATGLRITLGIFAVGLLAVPVPQPWAGPPEPFIRWKTYSLAGELLWRGTFANFALGNLVALTDPAGRHALYTAFMSAQCFLHASVMLVDNRISAAIGGLNGNPEHAWSEIPGFYFIGTVLLCFLTARLACCRGAQAAASTSPEPPHNCELQKFGRPDDAADSSPI